MTAPHTTRTPPHTHTNGSTSGSHVPHVLTSPTARRPRYNFHTGSGPPYPERHVHGHRHGHTLPRFAPTTDTTAAALIAAHTDKKSPHTGVYPVGVTFLFSYKFHYLIGGFTITRTDKFCFGKSAVYFWDVLFGLMVDSGKSGG